MFVLLFNMSTPEGGENPPLLNPWIGLVYMSMHIVMTLYPITVVRQDWLNPKHYCILFAPVAVFFILFLFFIGQWTPLPNPASVWENANQPDVAVRLVSLFAMAPYCLILFWLPYNYKKSSATLGWIIGYSLGLTIICVVHIVLMLTYSPILMALLPLLASTFYYQSTEYELSDRLRPPHTEEDDAPELAMSPIPEITPLDGPMPEFGLWSRVCQLMDKQEAWRDPDLSLSELARLSGTNITYLNRIIKQETGMGFKDYINTKRVKSVATQLKKNPDLDIQEAFFNAGFRSRTTAWRNFKDIVGSTPTEFKQSLK
jgi:AraC-like DNA-binding protein